MIFRIFFIAVFALVAAPTIADDADKRVDVPSLKVKERLHSLEQINVTAEKPKQDIQPTSQVVVDLLSEADRLDSESAEPQSAAH
jgi:hypothetical protein